jgi:energy-coupling factor transport system substrate-specific component
MPRNVPSVGPDGDNSAQNKSTSEADKKEKNLRSSGGKPMNTKPTLGAAIIATMAVMTAVIAVLTAVVQIPLPATGGYIHFGDAGVYFASFAFGPVVGLVGGGVGCAVADILSGYASWAPLTLVAHGLQGLIAGYFGKGKGLTHMLIGWGLGSLVLVAIYFLGEWFIYGLGYGGALAEVGPNFVQEAVGGLIGIPLVLAVRRAYPPIDRIGLGRTWEEET